MQRLRYIRTALPVAVSCFLLTHANESAAEAERGHRPIPSWYLSLGTSVSFVEDSYFTTQGGGTNADGTLNFDTGYGLSGAIGYRPRYTNSFWDNTRFELELALLDNEIESTTINGAGTSSVDDDIQSSRIMANMYLDYDATKNLRPYIGGGIGIARIHIEDEEETTFAYQGMVGVSYIPSSFPITEFNVGYRYLGTENPVFTIPATGAPYEMEYDAHMLELGMKAYF